MSNKYDHLQRDAPFRWKPRCEATHGMNQDATPVAEFLEASPLVRCWQRNQSRQQVELYRWDDSAGFYPDSTVSLQGCPGEGIALLETKAAHLWGNLSKVDKSLAVHADCGHVFMMRRKRGEHEFVCLRALGNRLQSNGAYRIDRLRFQ